MRQLGWLEITSDGLFSFEADVTFLFGDDFLHETLTVHVSSDPQVRQVKLIDSQMTKQFGFMAEYDTQTHRMRFSPNGALVILPGEQEPESFVIWVQVHAA